VAFAARLSLGDIFPALNSAIAVTHITKDNYTQYGNITVRFHEAIISNVPALIPEEYIYALPVGLDGKLVVKSPEDVVEKVKWLSQLSSEERELIVRQQEEVLMSIADPRPSTRVDRIEMIARG
jgi:hypothetical protein